MCAYGRNGKTTTRLFSPKIDSLFQVLFVEVSNKPVLRRFYPEDKKEISEITGLSIDEIKKL